MKLTRHARVRCGQRGIPSGIVDLLTDIGEVASAPGGVLRLTIPKREKARLIHELKNAIHMIERASGKEVVLSSDGAVITAYHRT